MKYAIAALILTAAALPATAYARDSGDTDTTAAVAQPAVLDSCMALAAVRASYTDAADDQIYTIARKKCGGRRAATDSVDVESARSFAVLVGGLRERRRRENAVFGLREVAAR